MKNKIFVLISFCSFVFALPFLWLLHLMFFLWFTNAFLPSAFNGLPTLMIFAKVIIGAFFLLVAYNATKKSLTYILKSGKTEFSGFRSFSFFIGGFLSIILGSAANLSYLSSFTYVEGHSRTSATKSHMSCLKTALGNYNADLSHYPHSGGTKNLLSAYNDNTSSFLGLSSGTNCLAMDEVEGFEYLGMEKEKYMRRWKGPYMDGEPEDFMCDAWGEPFKYFAYGKTIFLQSSGPDEQFDPIEKVLDENYLENELGDDIFIEIARVRKPFIASETEF